MKSGGVGDEEMEEGGLKQNMKEIAIFSIRLTELWTNELTNVCTNAQAHITVK